MSTNPDLVGTVAKGFAKTTAGHLKLATGTVTEVIDFPVFYTVSPQAQHIARAYEVDWKEFKPEPCDPPHLGEMSFGFWIRDDGVLHWSLGIVDRVVIDIRCVIVDQGSLETDTGRSLMDGTRPPLGFQ
ncbi:hypothetical protein BJX64DRAFT_264471 [Aspergillus heterothallicus]